MEARLRLKGMWLPLYKHKNVRSRWNYITIKSHDKRVAAKERNKSLVFQTSYLTLGAHMRVNKLTHGAKKRVLLQIFSLGVFGLWIVSRIQCRTECGAYEKRQRACATATRIEGSVRARTGNEAGRWGTKGMNGNSPEAASDGPEQNEVLRGRHGKNGSGETLTSKARAVAEPNKLENMDSDLEGCRL